MDLPSNPNFSINHGNRNTRIPEQNFHVNNLTLTPAQIESIREKPVYSDLLLHGGNSGSNNSINLISSKQDLQGINQTSTAAETEQMMIMQQQSRQPAEYSEQNHHPVNNQTVAETEQMRTQQQSGQLPEMSTADSAAVPVDRKRKAKSEADRKKTKREVDRRYREKIKLKLTTLEAETKSQKEQLDSANQRCETKQRELVMLREDFVKLKKKYKKQHKQRADMELRVTTLKAEKEQFEGETKSLKEQLDFANQRCETKQMELDKLGEDFVELKKKYEKEHESNQTLVADNGSLRDKYIGILEKSNPLVNGSGTQSNEPGQQHGQTTNLSSERDYGSSGIDSITQLGRN